MRTVTVFLALTWLTGCSQRGDLFAVKAPQGLDAEEQRIIQIAAEFVSTNQNWPAGEFERPKQITNGGWSVVARYPGRGDVNMLISIDGAGKVTGTHAKR